MKLLSALVFLILLLFSCTKTNDRALTAGATSQALKATDTAKIPINDLGTGTYMSYVGGLYPGGTNTPSGTYAKDLLNACKMVVPIDTFGNASATGNIVFISIGGSTSGHLFDSLQSKTANNPKTNPALKLLKCSNGFGSASLNSIINPEDPYWEHVIQIIHGSSSSYRQVQVIYLESDDTSVNVKFPSRPDTVKTELQACFRTLKQQFPNCKLVYLLGRTKTFEYDTIKQKRFNREPAPYYFGWAVKWAIQDQINGAPGTAYKGKNPVSPLITWGWYEWGTDTPRQDGFMWTQADTKDGLHATPVGEDTLSTRFQNFLLKDQAAKAWYAKH
jgi:hypothetical protein